MTPIKRRLLYIFRGTLLRIRITWDNGKSLTLSIGYNIDKADSKGRLKWDGCRCKLNTTHGKEKVPASIINRKIEQIEESIENAFAEFERQDSVPTKDELRELISGRHQELYLIDYYDKFISEGESIMQWSKSTVRKMKTLRKILFVYDSKLKLSDVNSEMMKKFMAWQTSNAATPANKVDDVDNELIKYKGKYQNETINKNIKHLKWFLRWAVGKGYMQDLDFLNHKLKYKTSPRPVIYLTWDELMRVYNIDLHNRPELEKTRDMFCLECFTSMRYSDIINLRWSNINYDCIEITTIKTTDSLIIDLNDYSREILNKYRTDDIKPDDKVFQSKSSQKMNVRLKEIAKLCDLN